MNMKVAVLAAAFVGYAIVSLAPPSLANLIVNGDFESGNTEFSTDYGFSPGGIRTDGTYHVLTDPSSAHSEAASYGDHTSGSGLMMAVNGSPSSGLIVWSQTLTVTPNTDYHFSAWISSWVSASPATLRFLINGESIGVFTAPAISGVWQQSTATWNSGSSTSATIQIFDLNTAHTGNDFALDDLALTFCGDGTLNEPEECDDGNVFHGDGCDSHCLVEPSTCVDVDSDGYGFPGDPSCPMGGEDDCNDASCITFPGASELFDGLDNNCDGVADEGLDNDGDGIPNFNDLCSGTPAESGVGPNGCAICVADPDNDGDGFPASVDCNDGNGDINPGAPEACNGADDDCDGLTDEGFDLDGDGFTSCASDGNPADCDDGNAAINPNVAELPGNAVDENCDGSLGACDPNAAWNNHGEYVRCVSHEVEALVAQGVLTQEEGDALVQSAAQSDIGRAP